MGWSREGYITMTEAADAAPGRPQAAAVWRWCRSGVRARNGTRIYLQHIRLGGQIYTTHAWLREFGAKLAAADAEFFRRSLRRTRAPSPRPKTRCDHGREAAIARAERRLKEAGV